MAQITRRRFVSGTIALGVAASMSDLQFVGAADRRSGGELFYVIDSRDDAKKARVLVYDSITGERTGRLPARYHADLAVSPDGRLVFVCDSVVFRDPPTLHATAKVKVFDALSLKRIQRFRAPSRPIYSVAPFASRMLVSDDSRYLYVSKRRFSRKGKARYRVRVYDVQKEAYEPYRFKVPETPFFMSSIPGSTDLLFGLRGIRLEGIGQLNPRSENRVSNLHRFPSPMKRGLEYMTAGVAVHQGGKLAYAVTRNGKVRVLNIPENRSVTNEVQLEIPPHSSVPSNQVLVWGNHLLVGVSTSGEASEGKADSVFVFDSTSFRLVNSYGLDLPSHQLALAQDGSSLYAASFSPHNCITTYSKGRNVATLQTGANSMTRFVVAKAPEQSWAP
jgi:hypothetical protein